MNRPELYKKTVDILFQAYFNDTLEHQNCMACAVGNLVAAGMGYTFDKYACWNETLNWKWFNNVKNGCTNEIGIQQVLSTGYSANELNCIEIAFESAYHNRAESSYSDEVMFNGLVAVLEVLKQIHEIPDNEPELNKFRAHYQTKKLS